MDGVLLDRVAQLSGFFISDLHNTNIFPRILPVLQVVAWRDYPLSECNYCLSYILSRQVVLGSYEELELFLKRLK